MHARVVNVQIQPSKSDEAISLFNDSVIPTAKQQKGFVSVMLLIDRDTGKGLSVSVWETEADLHANEANAYFQQQLAKFGGIFAAPPMREAYEVGAHS